MMRRMRWLPLCAALVALGCSDLLQGGYRYGRLEVRVLDGEGAPLSGVRLELYNRVGPLALGETDARGVYEFRFVPFGEVGVRGEPPAGYRPLEGTEADLQRLWIVQSDRQEVEFVFVRVEPDP